MVSGNVPKTSIGWMEIKDDSLVNNTWIDLTRVHKPMKKQEKNIMTLAQLTEIRILHLAMFPSRIKGMTSLK